MRRLRRGGASHARLTPPSRFIDFAQFGCRAAESRRASAASRAGMAREIRLDLAGASSSSKSAYLQQQQEISLDTRQPRHRNHSYIFVDADAFPANHSAVLKRARLEQGRRYPVGFNAGPSHANSRRPTVGACKSALAAGSAGDVPVAGRYVIAEEQPDRFGENFFECVKIEFRSKLRQNGRLRWKLARDAGEKTGIKFRIARTLIEARGIRRVRFDGPLSGGCAESWRIADPENASACANCVFDTRRRF